jgi:cell division protein FtsQ
MDGGGRFLRPLTAGTGRQTARAAVADWGYVPPSFSLPSLSFRLPRRPKKGVAVSALRRLPRFLGTGLTFAFFGFVGAIGTVEGGHWAAIKSAYGEPHHILARAVGLGLNRIVVSGLQQLDERQLLLAAGITPNTSLAFLSAADIRERIERVPLVESASVRKLYPNELVIALTERAPHAIWQYDGELFVVASDGTQLDLLQDPHLVGLPFVVGEGANARTKEFLALLDAAGPLRQRIRAGTLVAGRRWTLKMDNGLDVRLPELGAKDAVRRLVALDRDQKIMDKDVLALDLRMPDRVVVRLSEEAAAARGEALKKKPTRGKGIDT